MSLGSLGIFPFLPRGRDASFARPPLAMIRVRAHTIGAPYCSVAGHHVMAGGSLFRADKAALRKDEKARDLFARPRVSRTHQGTERVRAGPPVSFRAHSPQHRLDPAVSALPSTRSTVGSSENTPALVFPGSCSTPPSWLCPLSRALTMPSILASPFLPPTAAVFQRGSTALVRALSTWEVSRAAPRELCRVHFVGIVACGRFSSLPVGLLVLVLYRADPRVLGPLPSIAAAGDPWRHGEEMLSLAIDVADELVSPRALDRSE